jgi:hypothetical protein
VTVIENYLTNLMAEFEMLLEKIEFTSSPATSECGPLAQCSEKNMR